MAADVAAYIQNGALFIAESAGEPGGQNGVQIMEVAAGTMRVIGLQTDDGGVSSVNGHTSQDFSGISSLFINLGGGNDRVVVGDLSSHPSITHLESVYINVDGTNQPNSYGFDWDKVTVRNLVTTGILDIRTGVGNDIVTVADSIVGNDDLDNLNVYTGEGSDAVNLDNVDVKGNLLISSADNASTAADSDQISMLTVTAHNGIIVETGSGKDTLTATDVTSTGGILFDLGAGNDTATMNSVRAHDDFDTKMGDGDDTLSVTFLSANRLTLDGGANGNVGDALTTGIDGQTNLVSEVNWELINGHVPPPPFKPFSSISALPAAASSTTFAVSWSGTEPGGPGIASYNIYVSDNGGAFTPWLTGVTTTSATYAGQFGHAYGFYSVAVDNGGLAQATPIGAQATIELVQAADVNGKYVVAVYSDVLNRAPDPDGLNYWTQLLDSGSPPSKVAESIAHSAEYYANFVIKPDYLKLLNRAADDAGVANSTALMKNGLTDQQLEADLVASDEFFTDAGGANTAWVDGIYQKLLSRQADASGEAYWDGQLAAGVSRSDIAQRIAGSTENNTQLINDDYFHYLGRAADAGGLDYWLGQFAAGKANEDIVAGFTGSAEYYKAHTS